MHVLALVLERLNAAHSALVCQYQLEVGAARAARARQSPVGLLLITKARWVAVDYQTNGRIAYLVIRLQYVGIPLRC